MTDARLQLLHLHSLSMATVRGPDAESCRELLRELADYAAEEPPLGPEDPRSDTRLAPGIAPAGAARRFAARLRGTTLGAAAHGDTVRKELEALALAALEGESFDRKLVLARAVAAWECAREALESDLVQLGLVPAPPHGDEPARAAWFRRWGSVRSLELNAFVATFTRDGTHPKATSLTQRGSVAAALRFSLAVAQAGLSLAQELPTDPALVEDALLVEPALAPMLASLAGELRAR